MTGGASPPRPGPYQRLAACLGCVAPCRLARAGRSRRIARAAGAWPLALGPGTTSLEEPGETCGSLLRQAAGRGQIARVPRAFGVQPGLQTATGRCQAMRVGVNSPSFRKRQPVPARMEQPTLGAGSASAAATCSCYRAGRSPTPEAARPGRASGGAALPLVGFGLPTAKPQGWMQLLASSRPKIKATCLLQKSHCRSEFGRPC